MAAKNYLDEPFHRVRRSDRAVEDDGWIRSFLKRAAIGFLATTVGEQPFIHSSLFVYDEGEHVIYMHTAKVGRTRAESRIQCSDMLQCQRDGAVASRRGSLRIQC